jgi:hypothetical protein
MLFRLRFREIAICPNVLRVTQGEITLGCVRNIDRACLFFIIAGRPQPAGFNREEEARQDKTGQKDLDQSETKCGFTFLHQYETIVTVRGVLQNCRR